MITRKRARMSRLQLEDLPDELILKVFESLKTLELIYCSQVSKRIRRISQDEMLWKKVNLYGKNVPTKFLKLIVENQCKHLSLPYVELQGTNLKLVKPSNLKYLEMTKCQAENGIIEELLESCNVLQKLSLAWLSLENSVIQSVCSQNGQTLKVLHLYGLELNFETVKQVVDKCVNLSEVNFSDTKLCPDSVNYLVENLTPNVQKLSLQDLESVTDERVSTLVIRCNKLTSLDLFKTSVTNAVLTSIITHLASTLEELGVSQNKIDYIHLFFDLRFMPKLKVLVCKHLPANEIEDLKLHLPHLHLNPTCLKIATSYQFFEPQDGFWEIVVKQLQLFEKESDSNSEDSEA